MPRRSFFSDMRCISDGIKRLVDSDRAESVFQNLVCFVESADFSTSLGVKFICKNWRYGYDELSRLWASQGNTERKQTAFRSQASSVSRMLYSMFPGFSRELFLSEPDADSEADFLEIETTIDVVQSYFDEGQVMFISEVLSYPDSLLCSSDISVADCQDTIRRLKPYMRSEVYKYLDDVDIDQLKFILSILSRPLFKARGGFCDLDKLALLRAFASAPFVPALTSSPDAVAPKAVPAVKEAYVEVPECIPYNLGFTKAIAGILAQRENDAITPEETSRYQNMSEAERIHRKTQLSKLLLCFTEEGFRDQLQHYNPIELREVLSGDYPMKDGSAPYQFRK